jgi:hypothetical protein
MAADQPNRGWWTYVDTNGQSWNKLGKIDAGCNAIDGSTAAGDNEDYPRATRRRRPRIATFQDPATFRTASCVVYTDAAFAAIVAGATLDVHVPGETAAVTYTLSNKTPGKDPTRADARNLIDHA